jgi:quercetin dioxygenase-like cupin family protein
MRTELTVRRILLSLVALLTITSVGSGQSTTPAKRYTIDNCVNVFSQAKVEPTQVGYQYWFVDRNFLDGRTLKMSVVAPRQATHAPHTHAEDEIFFVQEGTAELSLDGQTRVAGAHSSFYCPPGSLHGIRNAGDTELKYLVIKKYEASTSATR